VLAVTGRGALAAVSVTAGALGADVGTRSGSVGRPVAVG